MKTWSHICAWLGSWIIGIAIALIIIVLLAIGYCSVASAQSCWQVDTFTFCDNGQVFQDLDNFVLDNRGRSTPVIDNEIFTGPAYDSMSNPNNLIGLEEVPIIQWGQQQGMNPWPNMLYQSP